MKLLIEGTSGDWDDVDGGADPGGFEDVPGAIDRAEIDGHVAGEAYDVPRLALFPRAWSSAT